MQKSVETMALSLEQSISADGVIGILLDRSKRHPDKEALTVGDTRISYGALAERARAIAWQLRQCGIQPGDRVGLFFPNHPDYVASFFAVAGLGATIVPINPLLKSEEISHILSDSGTKILVLHQSGIKEATSAVEQLSVLTHLLVSPAVPSNFSGVAVRVKVESLTDLTDAPNSFSWPETVKTDRDIAVLVYTSGTTGKPKGAMLTHKNVLSIFPSRLDMFDLGEADVCLAALPLCHIYGLTVVMMGTLSKGARLVIVPKFEAAAVLQILTREKVTVLPAVPSMYQFLLMEHEKNPCDLSALRICFTGAAALAPQVLHKIEKCFGAPVMEGYGLTESSCVATINPLHGPRKIGSVGPALPGLQIEIADKNGKPLPPGKDNVGEIIISGPNVMQGYHGQKEATAQVLKNGWFHTGDLGYKDGDGYIFIVGREKELIIRGGQNIYPREIEEVLLRMQGIADAAVIGVPDELMGERVKAFVVKAPAGAPAPLTVESIKEHCAAILAEYKVPRLVEFVDSLPRNSTGKVLKRLLS
jgi:long-chain acyl-CoA synthetase